MESSEMYHDEEDIDEWRNQQQTVNNKTTKYMSDTVKIVLPTEITPIQSFNPKNILLFGLQKCGKTTILSKLPGCLIIDTEVEGTEFVAALRIKVPVGVGPVSKMKWLKAVAKQIRAEGCPYDYVAIDTLTEVDEWAEWSGTMAYMESIAGKNFNRAPDGKMLPPTDINYESVHTLPNGYGYRWSRNEMTEIYELFQSIGKVCTIFVCHVMDKNVISKLTNSEVKTMDISLTGKVRDIIGRRVTGIGYVYNKGGELMVSFKGNEDKIGGIRAEHIRGYEGPMDWNKIFIKEK